MGHSPPLTGAILVSFDVSASYHNLPLSPTIDEISTILNSVNVPRNFADEFLSLVKVYLTPNIGKFNNNFYKFADGLRMGCPLSPLLAEVFMNRFENELSTSGHPLTNNINLWVRYVDDVLCLWTGNLADLNLLLDFLNSRYPSIKFTMEVGGESINFLDLNIDITQGEFQFSIFRKPTSTDVAIDGASFCPTSHKHASLHAMVNRLLDIPLNPQSYKKELAVIKQTFDVDNFVRKKRISKALESTTTHRRIQPQRDECKFIRLPFLGQISLKISEILETTYKYSSRFLFGQHFREIT